MGKHERELIKEAEKIVVRILKGQGLTASEKKNYWVNHAFSIADKIKNDFSKITTAHHLGDRYDNTGDILIVSDKKKLFIELKMSDTKLGIGTKANISQDALTENFLFVGKVKNWSKFRQEKRHNEWVIKYLNRGSAYPKNLLKIINSVSLKEAKARFLRGLAKKGNKVAKQILGDIRNKDRIEKIEYLNYLRSRKQNGEFIKRFFILIFMGIHKKEILKELIGEKDIFKEVENLFIYYANCDNGRIVLRRENIGEKIRAIIQGCSNFKIIFPHGMTCCKIIAIKNRAEIPLLQIVLHWKNISQGIKTPCLNIFDLSDSINRK